MKINLEITSDSTSALVTGRKLYHSAYIAFRPMDSILRPNRGGGIFGCTNFQQAHRLNGLTARQVWIIVATRCCSRLLLGGITKQAKDRNEPFKLFQWQLSCPI